MLNWDDLRFVLAIARTGTLSAAALRLGVNQTTVSRRLLGCEQTLSRPLFLRSGGQLKATRFAERFIKLGEDIEKQLVSLNPLPQSHDQPVSGTVRLTTVTGLGSSFIIPALPDFYQQFTHIQLDITTGNASLNIDHREADIAIRMARPKQGQFLMRKLCDVGYGIFAHSDYAPARDGTPCWITLDDQLSHIPEMRWLNSHYPDRMDVLKVADTPSLMAAVKAGIGQAILPFFKARSEPSLRCLSGADSLLTREFWLLTHPAVKTTPRFKVTADWIYNLFHSQSQLFTAPL